jgi:hypothetical protein
MFQSMWTNFRENKIPVKKLPTITCYLQGCLVCRIFFVDVDLAQKYNPHRSSKPGGYILIKTLILQLHNDKRISYNIMEQLYDTKLQNLIKIFMIKLCNN